MTALYAFYGALVAIDVLQVHWRLLPVWPDRLLRWAALFAALYVSFTSLPQEAWWVAAWGTAIALGSHLIVGNLRCPRCRARFYGRGEQIVSAPASFDADGRRLVWLDCEGGGHLFEETYREPRPAVSSSGTTSFGSGGSSSSGSSGSPSSGFSGGGGGQSGGGGADREY